MPSPIRLMLHLGNGNGDSFIVWKGGTTPVNRRGGLWGYHSVILTDYKGISIRVL